MTKEGEGMTREGKGMTKEAIDVIPVKTGI
jgi:hypothetical protein